MLIVISPAKTLDMEPARIVTQSQPQFLPQAAQLAQILRALDAPALSRLMGISDELAQLNVARFAAWRPEMRAPEAKQAVLAFAGDVYDGLQADTLDQAGLEWAQQYLRILSGLYGLLRPLDLMLPYRLEMGTRLNTGAGVGLYKFWGETQTRALQQAAADSASDTLLNLASEEYFKAVQEEKLGLQVIHPVFEDEKNGKYKVISFFAKRARGAMARYAITQRLRDPLALQEFNWEGYAFAPHASEGLRWVFRRRAPA
ncbi:peroxide stress protein YaaA [Massilia sp. W12]|uniref:peroxide stress protein YaaA n=1 Tax=Massilia sp. W12 TaxID=3126507 RepID=UPI0030CA605C